MKSVMLEQRLLEVRERIERACDRAGRPVESVTLVAVTKTHPPEAITELLALGIRDIGENRVQELDAKVGAIGRDRARWHLIGHLQRNKVGRALELTDLLHSIDSVRLARRVSGQAQAVGRVVEALV